MSKKTALAVNNLTKYFGEKMIIKNVSFEVEQGDIFGFLGPNGAGKTTTIRCILGLIHPNSGSIKINEIDISEDFIGSISKVGAIIESPKFYQHLTGYQNLLLSKNIYPQIPLERIYEVLKIVGLSDEAQNKVKTYSLGMKQRLGIARTLINFPEIIFLDEPTNGLDPQGIIEVRELIKSLTAKYNITIFVTSHLLHEVEQLCNTVAIMKNGEIIALDKVNTLLGNKNEVIRVYTNSLEKASDILKRLDFVNIISLKSDSLILEIQKGQTSTINRLLNSQNILVNYLIPEKQSLEELFLHLTQGGGENV